MRDAVNHAEAEVDARLSEWGRASRAAAGPVAVPTALMAAPARAARSAPLLRVSGAVAMVALVVATVIGLPRYLRPDRTEAPSIAGVTSTATARPGFQVVTFHGLSITVPSSWRMNESEPCKITREVVLLPGARTLCKGPDTPSIAFVEFRPRSAPLGLTGPIKTSKARISGIPAPTGSGRLGRHSRSPCPRWRHRC